MRNFLERVQKFMTDRSPHAGLIFDTQQLGDSATNDIIKPIHLLISFDISSGLRQFVVAVPSLGKHGELEVLTTTVLEQLKKLAASIQIGGGNPTKGYFIQHEDFVESPKVIIYTDELHMPLQDVVEAFKTSGLVEVIEESAMHSTVFVSYGGPDEKEAGAIVKYLSAHGVKTWFFPDDSVPGKKLHRTMSDGIEEHDRVLLICSKSSLERPGVLNEIERVLEREAREGGTEIFLPITLDDFVYSEWHPKRPDIAQQIRSRVIARIPPSTEVDEFKKAIDKLLKALKR